MFPFWVGPRLVLGIRGDIECPHYGGGKSVAGLTPLFDQALS